MILIASLLTLFYILLIGAYYIQWLRIPYFHKTETDSARKYSILIPARNEQIVIVDCLKSLTQLNFDISRFELLVIDDHSNDNTAFVVKEFQLKNPSFSIQLIEMKDDLKNRTLKKAAITKGIEVANYEYIILTDADCTRGPNWLSTIDSFIAESNAKMVYAPVVFNAHSVFEKLQSLEFAGLVGVGGAAIEMQKPNMCSAANLIFEKSVFKAVNGYAGSENQATGDDEYLMHKVALAFPGLVRFLKSREAIVYTKPNSSITELINQRRRWVSKSAKYENKVITAILVAAYLFNAGILFHLLVNPLVGILLLTSKMAIEGLFLYNVLSFFNRKSYILLLPLAEPFHILYVLVIGIWANIGTYDWKGRTVK